MTKIKPLTVILGTYKNPELIIPTLEGLKDQTFKDFVVFVVDDNLPTETALIDRAKKIISSYAELEIHYVKNETNIGVPHVFRKWIGLSHTRYFYICGAGDHLFPDAFELMVSFLDSNDEASMVHSREISGKGICSRQLFNDSGSYDAFYYLKSHLMLSGNRKGYSWSQASAMFRTELFNIWNTPITSYHYWDYYFHCTYLLYSKKIGYINVPLAKRHDDQSNVGYKKLSDFITTAERNIQALVIIKRYPTILLNKNHNIAYYKLVLILRLLMTFLIRNLSFNERIECLKNLLESITKLLVSTILFILLIPISVTTRLLFILTKNTIKYR